VPSWGEVLQEILASATARGQPDFDGIRRRYLARLNALTGRPVILYSTDWLRSPSSLTFVELGDMQGMMEVCRGVAGPSLDLILHSPGGSAEATASIVRYLRRTFDDIRVFVPLAAMSAATMWALAGDVVVMGKHSQLGPIDPQLVTDRGPTPARAIIEQFERAKAEVERNPAALGAWAPILQQYGPALLEQCERAEELARYLVRKWVAAYMLRRVVDDLERARRAETIASYFSDYEARLSHSLGIDRDEARAAGVEVSDLETDDALQDAVLSVHHAALHMFTTPAVKLIENHLGHAFVLNQAQPGMGLPAALPSTSGGLSIPLVAVEPRVVVPLSPDLDPAQP
jgi:hypothetical protein